MNLTFLTQPGKTICFSTILKRSEAKDSPHPHRLSPSLSVVSVLMSWYALKYAKSPICSFFVSKFARGHFRYLKRSWAVIRVRNSKRIMNEEEVMSRCLNNDNFPRFLMFGTAILPKVLIYDFGLKDDFFTTWKGRRLKKYWDKKPIFRCGHLGSTGFTFARENKVPRGFWEREPSAVQWKTWSSAENEGKCNSFWSRLREKLTIL